MNILLGTLEPRMCNYFYKYFCVFKGNTLFICVVILTLESNVNMTTFSIEYTELRDHLISVIVEQNQLNYLIREFQSEINSKRRSSYINSIEELIKVLEKRGYLESNFLKFLERFANKVPAINKQDMMTRYQSGFRPTGQRFPGVNAFGSSALPAYSRQHSYGSVRSGSSDTGTIQEPYSVLPSNVTKKIVRDIGTNWKDLARELSVCEGDIDDIECKYPRQLQEKARACLKIFLDEADPYRVQSILLDALNRCGRRDLKESVQEILNRRPY